MSSGSSAWQSNLGGGFDPEPQDHEEEYLRSGVDILELVARFEKDIERQLAQIEELEPTIRSLVGDLENFLETDEAESPRMLERLRDALNSIDVTPMQEVLSTIGIAPPQDHNPREESQPRQKERSTMSSPPSAVTHPELAAALRENREYLERVEARLDAKAREDRAEILAKIDAGQAELRSDLRDLTQIVNATAVSLGEMRGELKSLDDRMASSFWKNTTVAAGVAAAIVGGVAGLIAAFT